MREDFDKNAQITVRQIGPDDWAYYHDFYKGLKDPHHFNGPLDGKDPDDPVTWQDLLNTTDTDGLVMFGMFDRDTMIGQTSIQFMKDGEKTTALLAGSEIADDRRGQGLVDKLYQSRTEYLKNTGFQGDVLTTIRPENTTSRKAAARNGFVDTGHTDKHGYCVYIPEDLG